MTTSNMLSHQKWCAGFTLRVWQPVVCNFAKPTHTTKSCINQTWHNRTNADQRGEGCYAERLYKTTASGQIFILTGAISSPKHQTYDYSTMQESLTDEEGTRRPPCLSRTVSSKPLRNRPVVCASPIHPPTRARVTAALQSSRAVHAPRRADYWRGSRRRRP